jgi:hypothetical protein
MLLVNAQRWHQRSWTHFFGGRTLSKRLDRDPTGHSFCRPKAAKGQLENPEMVMIYLVA